jgi:hypothetical protein
LKFKFEAITLYHVSVMLSINIVLFQKVTFDCSVEKKILREKESADNCPAAWPVNHFPPMPSCSQEL